MVYQPYAAQYTKKRNISQTRPAIGDDDDITKKSKELAVSKSLGNKEQTPSVMPTGNQKAPAVAARETIVNSAGSQAQKQGTAPNIGSIKAAPNFDMGMARHSGTAPPENNTESASNRDHDATPMERYERRAGPIPAAEPEHNTESARGRDYDATPIDFTTFGEGQFNYNPNAGNENNNESGSGDDPDGFGAILEQKLLEILGMDPTERARNEAGRALLAARSQAGRGQMGMSGAMLGLQSDVMGEASERAENYVMDRQLDAAKTGVKLEALDRAEQLGLTDWVRSATEAGNSAEEIYEMLTGPLGMDSADADILMGTIPEQDDAGIGSSNAQAFWASIEWEPPPGSWWEQGNDTGVDEGIVVASAQNVPDGASRTTWGAGIPRTFHMGDPSGPHTRYEYEDDNGQKHYFYVPE